jgi:endonuclease-3 related protein
MPTAFPKGHMNEVMGVYKALLDRYGPRGWWPADTPFEVMVGAILTQRTSWANVEHAIGNLKKASLLEVERLASASPERVMELVRPSGFYRQKAKRVMNLARHVSSNYRNLGEFFEKPVHELRSELLALEGIGKETADSIILYAGEKPIFVVDAYTKRLCQRLGLPIQHWSYDGMQSYFQENLPEDIELYKEYHALIVHHCKERCRTRPACEGCPLICRCAFAEKRKMKKKIKGGKRSSIPSGSRRRMGT